MLTEKQLNILVKIVDKEIKEIDNKAKEDFLTKKEHNEYIESYENDMDKFMEIKKINLKE
jgi:hypothetical protein